MKYQHMHINLNNRKIHVHLSLCSNWKGEKTLKKNNEQITPNETLLIRSFIGVNMPNSILDETFFPLANLARVHNTHNSHAKYNIFGFYQIEGHGTARLSTAWWTAQCSTDSVCAAELMMMCSGNISHLLLLTFLIIFCANEVYAFSFSAEIPFA